jgi:hypothetical protein
MSNPWQGYPFEAVFTTTDPSFKPAKLGIRVAEGYDAAEIPFRLSGL